MISFLPFGRGTISEVSFAINERYSSSITASQSGFLEASAKVSGSWFSETWAKREEAHWNWERVRRWSLRSPAASHVERTHQGSIDVGAIGGTWASGGGFSFSLSSSETGVGNLSRKLEVEEGTIVESGSQAKRFSSNLTSLLMIISWECGWRSL